MTSAINPDNIDGEYPVAGIPNNTQGFRDNFTNIKTNLQRAADEITELQNSAVLKAALAGTTLDNNLNNNLIYAAKIQDFSAAISQIATTSGSITLDYSEGHYQTISTTGSVSIAFSNFPLSGSLGLIRVRITVNNVAHTLTLPAAVTRGIAGVQGISSNVITFAATGTYEFAFATIDGGTTITMFDLNRPLLGNSQAAIGYGTGAGATVTQTTSRTTGVTINAYCGAITLVSAAGTTSWQTFTVTNSKVAATDTVIVNQKSGTDLNQIHVTAVLDGEFDISFATTGGTTTEQPVFNFAVVKSVTS